MSERPAARNGKRSLAWGTRERCPACGECLCFGCHPQGPCLDDEKLAAGSWRLARDHAAAGARLGAS